MEIDLDKVKGDLKRLLESQSLAVLATENRGQPYASLVAFASSEDLRSLYFATTRSTRKYANLTSESRAAMLVDNRSNRASDFRWAMAATATGRAAEVNLGAVEKARDLYLSKHPQLKAFVHSPTCALCELQVRSFFVVTRFQSVVEVHIG
jgi:heme iron utilization protein